MRVLVTALCGLGLAAACTNGAVEPAKPAQAAAALERLTPVAPIVVLPPARPRMPHPSCNPRRVVGLGRYDSIDNVSFPCPAPSGNWTGGNAFADRHANAVDGRAVCVYTLPDNVPYTMAGLPNLPQDANGPDVSPASWAEADCPAVTTLSDAGDEALQTSLSDFIARYRKQISRLAQLPVLRSPQGTPAGPFTVEVAILDSLNDTGRPEDPAQAARAEHGRAIKSLLSDLTCPVPGSSTSGCAVQLRTYQVFDVLDGGTQFIANEKSGASTDPTRRKSPAGHILTLARRIEDALASARARGVSRLIINLSVGYHPRFSGLQQHDDVWLWQRSTLALQAALKNAACQGAIVVGAIGNREDGSNPWNMAMFPGYLQTDTASCAANTTRPLLYGASGLNPQNLPVSNAIERSWGTNLKLESPFAAPGFAVGAATGDGAPLPLLTGSSFGAAGVSAVAALVWSYRPTLTSSQVMRIVYDSGSDTTREANSVPGNFTASTVHSVSVCGAVRATMLHLCNQSQLPSACLNVPSCVSFIPPRRTLPDPTAQALFELVPALDRFPRSYGPVRAGQVPPECELSGSTVLTAAGVPQSFCPWKRVNVIGAAFDPNSTPAQPIPLHGQPPHDPCRPCMVLRVEDDPAADGGTASFRPTATALKRVLLVALDPFYRDTLASPVLRSGTKALALGDDWIDAALEGPVTLALPDDFEPETSALSFLKTDDGTSVTSYVPRM